MPHVGKRVGSTVLGLVAIGCMAQQTPPTRPDLPGSLPIPTAASGSPGPLPTPASGVLSPAAVVAGPTPIPLPPMVTSPAGPSVPTEFRVQRIVDIAWSDDDQMLYFITTGSHGHSLYRWAESAGTRLLATLPYRNDGSDDAHLDVKGRQMLLSNRETKVLYLYDLDSAAFSWLGGVFDFPTAAAFTSDGQMMYQADGSKCDGFDKTITTAHLDGTAVASFHCQSPHDTLFLSPGRTRLALNNRTLPSATFVLDTSGNSVHKLPDLLLVGWLNEKTLLINRRMDLGSNGPLQAIDVETNSTRELAPVSAKVAKGSHKGDRVALIVWKWLRDGGDFSQYPSGDYSLFPTIALVSATGEGYREIVNVMDLPKTAFTSGQPGDVKLIASFGGGR